MLDEIKKIKADIMAELFAIEKRLEHKVEAAVLQSVRSVVTEGIDARVNAIAAADRPDFPGGSL